MTIADDVYEAGLSEERDMRIQAVANGRGGSICKGLGKLTFSRPVEHEAKQLLVIFQEIEDGEISFWTPLMWAASNERLT